MMMYVLVANVRLDQRLVGGIGLHVLERRLVRNVPYRVVKHALGGQLGLQRGQIVGQEFGVLRRSGAYVPAEQLLLNAVHVHYDLGRGLSAPLREQVRHLVILRAAALAYVYEAAQTVEAERVLAVGKIYVHQLAGHALAAHHGVQRGSVYGGKYRIDAAAHGGGDEFLQILPVLFRPHVYVIVLRNRVAVQPAGIDKLLRGQLGVQHVYLYGLAGGFAF